MNQKTSPTNPPEQSTLTEILDKDKLIDRLQGLHDDLMRLQEAHAIDSNNATNLTACKDLINHAIRAFDQKMLYVVCLGALKAGKSTLINALVEKDICPANPGSETTLHCSVIMASDDSHPEGITLYKARSKANNKQESIENTKLLLEYFQGINVDKFDNKFEKSERHELKEGEKIFSEQLSVPHFDFETEDGRSDIIIEIRVNVKSKTNVLCKNVALIDLPGLDGVKMNVDHPVVRCIPECSHYFLVVRSTVTAFNKTLYDNLKDWLGKNPAIKTTMVFNEMRAKFWHTEDSQQENLATQIDKDMKQWKEVITGKDKKDCDIDHVTVNAAMAFESKTGTGRGEWKTEHAKTDLCKASNIKILEDKLRDAADPANAKALIYRWAYSKTNSTLQEIKEKLEVLKKRKEDQIQESEKKADEAKKARENKSAEIKKKLGNVSENDIKNWRNKLDLSFLDLRDWYPFIQDAGNKTEYEQTINEFCEFLDNQCKTFITTPLREQLAAKITEENIPDELLFGEKIEERITDVYERKKSILKKFLRNIYATKDEITKRFSNLRDEYKDYVTTGSFPNDCVNRLHTFGTDKFASVKALEKTEKQAHDEYEQTKEAYDKIIKDCKPIYDKIEEIRKEFKPEEKCNG